MLVRRRQTTREVRNSESKKNIQHLYKNIQHSVYTGNQKGHTMVICSLHKTNQFGHHSNVVKI